jgi:hypothetical protein
MQVLGIVRLAPGRVGFFDEYTRIHLTIASPEKPVIEGMNTTNLKRAVKSGSIKLVSGSLDPETNVNPVQTPVPVKVTVPVTPAVQTPVVEDKGEDKFTEGQGVVDIKTTSLDDIKAAKEASAEPAVDEVKDEVPVEPVVEQTPAEEVVETKAEAVEEVEAPVEEAEVPAEVTEAPVVKEAPEVKEEAPVETAVEPAHKAKKSTKKK